jgi:tRNA-dihydrouridine synthase
MYSGHANWDEIGKAAALIGRERPETTFLGNGDIESLNDARQKTADYGLDGVLVGRATFGNPWFFSGQRPTASERLAAAVEHARLYESIFGSDPKVFAPMKKHLGWYCKGFAGAKELRLRLMAAESAAEVQEIIATRQAGKLFDTDADS